MGTPARKGAFRPLKVEAGIAPRFRESKAVKRRFGRKSCLRHEPDPKGRVSAKRKPVSGQIMPCKISA